MQSVIESLKKACPRLRELALAARGSQNAGSRNLFDELCTIIGLKVSPRFVKNVLPSVVVAGRGRWPMDIERIPACRRLGGRFMCS